MRLVIIEPRAELGEGIAYSTTDLGHLLNVRAGCLSALPDDLDHFTAWVRQHTMADGQSFLPRTWYGKYLRSLLGPIEHIHARAVQVSPRAAGVQITLSDGTRHTVDRVVLASGSSPSVWPKGLSGGLPRWIEDPWVPGIQTNLHPNEPVLLVGTGLTAVDVTLSLQAAGHGQIFATSRHGLLPNTHSQKPFAVLPVVPPSRPTALSLVAWARTTAAEVGDWRPVVDALRPHTDELWGALAIGERARLLRHVQRRWEVLRHRMPPSVAERIEAMRETGQLTIVPGGVRSANSTYRGVDVTLSDCRACESARSSTALDRLPMSVDHVIPWCNASSTAG
jgi:hydroxyacylglutathione hydrolase